MQSTIDDQQFPSSPGKASHLPHQFTCEASSSVDGGESFRSVRLSAAPQVVCCRRMPGGDPSRGQRTESITICRSSNANQRKKKVERLQATCLTSVRPVVTHTHCTHTLLIIHARSSLNQSALELKLLFVFLFFFSQYRVCVVVSFEYNTHTHSQVVHRH